jgi:hypothetical protein
MLSKLARPPGPAFLKNPPKAENPPRRSRTTPAAEARILLAPVGVDLALIEFARFSASPSRSKAAVIRLNRSSAALSPGFLSGWSSLASLRKAFLISSALAPLETPSSL